MSDELSSTPLQEVEGWAAQQWMENAVFWKGAHDRQYANWRMAHLTIEQQETEIHRLNLLIDAAAVGGVLPDSEETQ